MPTTDQLLAFALTAFVIIAVPGPSVVFVVSRSLTHGKTAGVLSVVGNSLGVFLQLIVVAVGLGALVTRSETLFTVIRLLGAAYLVYLGIQATRRRRALAEAFADRVEPKAARAVVRDGFLVGLSNPKATVFFGAILPQFINRPAGHVPLQMILLGSLFLTIGLISDSAWALAAGSARNWLGRSPRRLEMIGGTGGLMMIGIGVTLALSGRKD